MAEKRKLQLEMDKVFKKIEDGFEVFDQMNEKLNEAKNDNQREKFQDELKKEIKRLQRLRVQIKAWQQEPMIKEKDKKDKLADYRRAVEQRMESFKDIESKSKLKPYSKVALSLSMQEEKEERDERDESYFDSYSSGEMADLSQSPSKEDIVATGKVDISHLLPSPSPSPPPSPSRVRPPMMPTVQPTAFHQTETLPNAAQTSPRSAPNQASSSSRSSSSSSRSRSPSAPIPSTLQQAGERRTEDGNSLTVLDQGSAGEGVSELHVDFDAGLNPFFATASLPEGEDQEHSLEDQHTLAMLQRSADTCPLPMDSEVVPPHVRKMFRPAQCFPQTTFLTGPAERYDPCHLPLDALFFLFYHTPGSESQMLAAKALHKLSWRFHTQLQQWFRRLDDPTETTDEFERGSYVFFDSEMWAQREMTEFTFEYKYLLELD